LGEDAATEPIGEGRAGLMALRVLHAPTNPAGQATAFRDGLRELGIRSDVMTLVRNGFSYPVDRCLDMQTISGRRLRKRRRMRAAAWAALHYDVLHFHGGKTIMNDSSDLRGYRLAHKTLVMTYWGSDARLYSIAASRNPYYRLMGDDPAAERVRRERMRQMARSFPVATVPDDELREHVERYFDRVEVVPVGLRSKDVTPTLVGETPEPLVVHAPSRRDFKGTRFVLEAIETLRKRRVRFRFELVEGVSNERVREALARADVVVDQLLLGICGMGGLEAMAFGKPVVTYLREDLLGTYPAGFPAVPATKETLPDVVEDLLADLPRRLELGVAGRAYVERHHSPEVLGAKLLDLYGSL